jgi:hypothetical protein
VKRSHVGTIHANIKRQEGEHALSLSRRLDETTITAPLPERFSLDRLAGELHLDDDETAWFSAVYLDELSRPEAQSRLNWNLRRADRVRKRVNRKLARYRREADRAAFDPDWFIIRGSSLRMCYEERLPSGKCCWAMVQVDPGFQAILNVERADIFGKSKSRPKAKTCAA